MKTVGEKTRRIFALAVFVGLFLIMVPMVSAEANITFTNITVNNNIYNVSRWTFEINATNESNGITAVDSVIYILWNTSAVKAEDDASLFNTVNYTTTNTSSNFTRTFDANLTSFWPGQSFILQVTANDTAGNQNSTNFTITVQAANTSQLEGWLQRQDLGTNNVSSIDFRYKNSTDESSGFDIVNTTSDNYLMELTTNSSGNLLVTVGNFSEIDLNLYNTWELNTTRASLGSVPTFQINYQGFLDLKGFIPATQYTWGRVNTTGTWQKHYWLKGATPAGSTLSEITSLCSSEANILSGATVLGADEQCVVTNGAGNQILYSGNFSGWLIQKSVPSGDGVTGGGGGVAPRKRTVTAPSEVAPQALPSLPSVEGVSNTLSKIPVIGNTLSNWYDRIVNFFRS